MPAEPVTPVTQEQLQLFSALLFTQRCRCVGCAPEAVHNRVTLRSYGVTEAEDEDYEPDYEEDEPEEDEYYRSSNDGECEHRWEHGPVQMTGSDPEYLNPDYREVTVGIELEYVHPDRYGSYGEDLFSDLPRTWAMHYDGSLPEYPRGVELNSPPGSVLEWEQGVRDTVELVRQVGYQTSRDGGTHVHVACDIPHGEREEAHRVAANLYALSVGVQDSAYTNLFEFRRDNEYCGELEGWDNDAEVDEAEYAKTAKGRAWLSKRGMMRTTSRSTDIGEGRYKFLNFEGQEIGQAMRTVEFRAMPGTRRVPELLGWTAFCQGLVITAKKPEDEVERVLKLIDAHETSLVLPKLVLDKNLFNLSDKAREGLTARMERVRS